MVAVFFIDRLKGMVCVDSNVDVLRLVIETLDEVDHRICKLYIVA